MKPSWMEKESLEFFEVIRSQIEANKPIETVRLINSLIQDHEVKIDASCVSLYAGSNVLSPMARACLSSTLATRAAEGHCGAKHQKGVKYLEQIEAIVIELQKKLFKAKYSECRALSGSMANAMAFNALTKHGDTIMSLNVPSGGHISYRKFGAAGYRGLVIQDLPFDGKEMNVDLVKLREKAGKLKPKLLVLGASVILFPYPLKAIREIADEADAMIMYDGAHVDGLIAGGEFQDPLTEGVDVFTSSTHKTLGGPPGGMVLSNDDEVARKVDKAAFPGMTAQTQYHRLAATAITLAELSEFGHEYASHIIKNARSFGKALDNEGFDVLAAEKDYTSTHQVIVDVSAFSNGHDAANLLEEANIICNSNLLPKDTLDMVRHPSGLRLGVQEITKLGMKEPQTKEIAEYMKMVLLDKKDPSKIRDQVVELRKRFTRVHYCFE